MSEKKPDSARLVLARDVMISPAITTPATATVREVARLMLTHGVSTVPVLDEGGRLVGMTSDGDLLGRRSEDTLRDWWLSMLVEGDPSAPSIETAGTRRVRDVMSAPTIAVTPAASVQQVAELLQTHRLKRVPVVDDGKVVGVISRSDLLSQIEHAPAGVPAEPGESRLLSFIESLIGGVSLRGLRHEPGRAADETEPRPQPAVTVSAAVFRAEVEAYRAEVVDERQVARRQRALERRRKIKELLDEHVNEALWQDLIVHAELAARSGEQELLLLRFPSDLCSDGGRKIDVAETGWEDTLRGEAAEIHVRWRKDLRPKGFGLSARIVSYDEGVLGDIGLFLTWSA
jgi:CBS domain-containing protein